MLGNISERFLKDTEQGGRLIQIQVDLGLVRNELTRHAQLLFKLLALPVDGCDQAKIEDAGTQVTGDAMYGFYLSLIHI